MTELSRCEACGWERADGEQEGLVSRLMDQGIDSNLPTVYQVLGPKPEHTCDLDPKYWGPPPTRWEIFEARWINRFRRARDRVCPWVINRRIRKEWEEWS